MPGPHTLPAPVRTWEPSRIVRLSLIAVVLSFAVMAMPRAGGKTRAHVQVATVDAPLSQDAVLNWFDQTLQHGDGKPCAVRPGNDVEELIDGVDAMKAMAGAIQDT